MEFLLNRYRNLSVLLVVIFAQLLLLAYQVKGDQDVRLIRVWAVTAITPVARVIEAIRSHTVGFVQDYFVLLRVRDENRRIKDDLGRMKMENQFLKNELAMADRVKALASFQERTPSRTIAARVIATGTGANSKVVFIDRGSSSGVMRGMAVVTPDGIAGKITASYPTAAQVMLITDPSFAAGVISQKNRVHGTLKGQGRSDCIVDYVQNEETVEVGEWFYTSGDDRIFPKGMPVGQVKVARAGNNFRKDIYLIPSGLQNGIEEVLVVVEGVHEEIPEMKAASGAVSLLPAPHETANHAPVSATAGAGTDADKLRERYKRIGEAQNLTYGEGVYRTPNFNIDPDAVKKPASPAPGAAAKPPAGAVKPSAETGPPARNPPDAAETKPAVAKPVSPAPAVPKPKPAPPAIQ
jgi:rod shape-determining protein MreC